MQESVRLQAERGKKNWHRACPPNWLVPLQQLHTCLSGQINHLQFIFCRAAFHSACSGYECDWCFMVTLLITSRATDGLKLIRHMHKIWSWFVVEMSVSDKLKNRFPSAGSSHIMQLSIRKALYKLSSTWSSPNNKYISNALGKP